MEMRECKKGAGGCEETTDSKEEMETDAPPTTATITSSSFSDSDTHAERQRSSKGSNCDNDREKLTSTPLLKDDKSDLNSIPSFATALSSTASTAECPQPLSSSTISSSSVANTPLSCDISAVTKTPPKAPPIDGLLTIATPKLLKYVDGGAGCTGRSSKDTTRMFAERRETEIRQSNSNVVSDVESDNSLDNSNVALFRSASPTVVSSTPSFFPQRPTPNGATGDKSSPRSFSPSVLHSAASASTTTLALSTLTTSTSVQSTAADTFNSITTFTPSKIVATSSSSSSFIVSSSHTTTPSGLSPFASRLQQQRQQPASPSSSHATKAMPRLRLDFLNGGPVGLKRCNSAPAIDLKFGPGANNNNNNQLSHVGPYFSTTPTTPTSDSAIHPHTLPTTSSSSSSIAASSSSSAALFSHNSSSPSPFLPSPTRRASATHFRPIPAMSPSAAGVEGSGDVGPSRRNRRFSSNSVGGGCGGGARSTSPYPLPRTPSRLEQILNDEFCNPLAREEADEREMNEVASISSSCDKLDILGIETSSSSFAANNLSLVSNNNNNNGEDGVPTSGFQSGRGLSATFGLDLTSIAAPYSTPFVSTASTPTAATSTTSTRQSPLLPSNRSRTNSDPMAGVSPSSMPPSGGILGLPAAPSLHLSINLNPAGVPGAPQGSPSSALPTCSPSPTGSGGGGLSSVKQRFSPRRQVSYHHPPSPINRRSLSPLASAVPNGIKRKIHSSESSGSCWGGPDFGGDQPFPKFPRTSLSRGSTPERGFPTPSASPGLSPKGGAASLTPMSSSSSVPQSTSGIIGLGGVAVTSVVASSSASSIISSLPSSPSTPQPPSPSTLSSNPFSRSASPTPTSTFDCIIPGGGSGGKCPPLPFQDSSLHGRPLSISSSSADSSFSSLDESGNSAAVQFTGFTAAPRNSSSSSSIVNFCMTPPSNGSPAPPQELPQQPQGRQRWKQQEQTMEEGTRKFSWPMSVKGRCDEEFDEEKLKTLSNDSKSKVENEESVEKRDALDADTMETDVD